jgi:hypothetical protein
MDYATAIERACKHAHEDAAEQARNGQYGRTYLKHVANARFFEIVEEEGIDISDESVGSMAVDIVRGINAVQAATAD